MLAKSLQRDQYLDDILTFMRDNPACTPREIYDNVPYCSAFNSKYTTISSKMGTYQKHGLVSEHDPARSLQRRWDIWPSIELEGILAPAAFFA